jgi:transposase InsO family protein
LAAISRLIAARGGRVVLVELGVVEQRYRAVLEVLEEGLPVTEVARRHGVARQTVHEWLARYAAGGLGGLADRSSRPASGPHQMPAPVEARIVGMRRDHPGWGPSRIRWELERAGVVPLPGRSAVYRALIRHGLIVPGKRRRRREDYRRWERGRAMDLWQMDVMGRVFLAGGAEVKVVTGIDDHSRFVVCARAVLRATARPVCQALAGALSRHGIPEQILTDNGKVFTARFGRGPGPVLFDRICADNGIRHLTAKPCSPATTGKVERLHKTMRAEFFRAADGQHATLAELQAALDAWVADYNTARPHQSCGGRPPAERFRLADRSITPDDSAAGPQPVPAAPRQAAGRRPPGVSRWVNAPGKISLAGFSCHAGASYAGEPVEAVASGGLAGIVHAGVVIATHAQRFREDQADRAPRAPVARRARDATAGLTVTRLANGTGTVSFAGTDYQAGRRWARQSIDVSIVAGSVQLSRDGKVIRVHPIRHDRARELGALANPKGRPRRKNSAAGTVA